MSENKSHWTAGVISFSLVVGQTHLRTGSGGILWRPHYALSFYNLLIASLFILSWPISIPLLQTICAGMLGHSILLWETIAFSELTRRIFSISPVFSELMPYLSISLICSKVPYRLYCTSTVCFEARTVSVVYPLYVLSYHTVAILYPRYVLSYCTIPCLLYIPCMF